MMKSLRFPVPPKVAPEATTIASIPWQELIVELTTQHREISSEYDALSFARLYVEQEIRCKAPQSFSVLYLGSCRAGVVRHHARRG